MNRLVALLCVFVVNAHAYGPAKLSEAQERQREEAYALGTQGRIPEAKKILSNLLKVAPDDGGILFRYGYILYLEAAAEPNVKKADKLRKQARPYLVRAQQSGLDQPLIGQLLAEIAEDGSVGPKQYSANGEANREMHEGELAFHRRDYASALKHYTRALELDERLYSAALFIGDTYFVQGNNLAAAEWFTKATVIDPNSETAHRYLGDTLMRQGAIRQAGASYIDAVLAEPFTGLPWRQLREWAARNQLSSNHPAQGIPHASITIKADKVELGVDPAGGTLGMAYGIVLAAEAQKALGESRAYRHSLEIETKALRALLEIGEVLLADPKQAAEQKASPFLLTQVEELKQVQAAGLLEAYVFLVRANNGIAVDYPAYREANREKLVRYLREYYLRMK